MPAFSSRTPEGLLLLVALAIVGFWALRREVVAEEALVPAEVAVPAAPTPDLQARLDRLDDLHVRGVLDDGEYDAAREGLLEAAARRERGAGVAEPAESVPSGDADEAR